MNRRKMVVKNSKKHVKDSTNVHPVELTICEHSQIRLFRQIYHQIGKKIIKQINESVWFLLFSDRGFPLYQCIPVTCNLS